MKKVDLPYTAAAIVRLTGVPARIYKNGAEVAAVFPVSLPRDPMELYKKEIFALPGHVAYFCTPYFHYYGVLNAGSVRIVVGPTAQIMANAQKLRELAFEADVPPDQAQAFVDAMNEIERLPVETLLQLLCTLNHFLNRAEKLEISDLAINASQQSELKTGAERRRTSRVYEEDPAENRGHHTLAIEETLMDAVSRGDSEALKRLLSSFPPVHGGTIAGDQLRQMRNLFIVTATLVSRAAIRGGMREDDAFSLSDAYIRRVELLSDHGAITNLQYHMLIEFTEQVGALRRGCHTSGLALDAANYVRSHLSEPISVDKMAQAFFFSRPYLSFRFKKETGRTLTDFILNEKTEEAKRLLSYSDKSLSAIGAYLGFSSQGHFARVFKKYAGVTPGEYRENRRRK